MRGQGVAAAVVLAVIMAVAAIPTKVWATPSITSFTPAKASLGSVVTITGSGFTGTTSVKFSTVSATFTVVSATSIHATVPTLAITGKIRVGGPSGTATSGATFTVLPGIALSPAAGSPGSHVTVSGSGFGANELVDLYEGTTDLVLAATDQYGRFSGISLTVPTDAQPGPLWISAAGRHSQRAAQKAFTVRTDWLNPGRNSADSNWNPYENTLDTSSVRRLEMAWTTTGGNFFANTEPSLIVASGLIVAPLPSHGTIVALRTNGTTAWSRSVGTNWIGAPGPAAGGGIVVVPSTDGSLHAYTLATGAPKWTSAGPNDTGNGSAVVAGGVVFAPGATSLSGFNLNTGAVKWSYTGPCGSNVSTPAVAAGTVVFTCIDSSGAPNLVSLGTDGTLYNSFNTGAGTTSAPAVNGGNVYAIFGGTLSAYSLSAYNLKWDVVPPFAVLMTPAVGDGIVATCGDGGLWVVNAVNGSTRFSNSSYPCSNPVTIANGVIYEPQNGQVAMFDEYGTPLGRLGSGGNIGHLSVVDGSVYGVDSVSGVDRWAIPAAGSISVDRGQVRPNVKQLQPDKRLKPYRSPICVRLAAAGSSSSREICTARPLPK